MNDSVPDVSAVSMVKVDRVSRQVGRWAGRSLLRLRASQDKPSTAGVDQWCVPKSEGGFVIVILLLIVIFRCRDRGRGTIRAVPMGAAQESVNRYPRIWFHMRSVCAGIKSKTEPDGAGPSNGLTPAP